MEKAWRYFDKAVWLLANGHEAVIELSTFMRQAAEVQQNRQEAVILMSDQIPVWLKPQADKVLQKTSVVEASAQARKRRATRKQLAAGQPQTEEKDPNIVAPLVKAAGNPASGRWRVSLIARQSIRHFWDPAREPVGHQ